MPIIVILLLLLVALFLIWKGSDWLTDSLVPVADKLGTSYIAITTILVSFMLSLPEIFSSVYSYFLGHLEIGLGVIIGSVMMNIGLGTGLSAVLRPLAVDASVVIRDGVFMIVVAAIVLLFGADLQYQRTEGIILLLLLVPYVLNVWWFEKGQSIKNKKEKIRELQKSLVLIGNLPFKMKASLATFIIGAGLLIGGSFILSYSLVALAGIINFPDMLIGLVVGAIGTGIPNIVANIEGTIKGYKDVAITETFGANIFTLLLTLGIIVVLAPLTIAPSVFYFDLTWMIIIHFLMLAFILKGYKYHRESISRFDGLVLVIFYIALVIIHAAFFE